MSTEPIILQTRRPPSARSLVLNWSSNAVVYGWLLARARRGSSGRAARVFGVFTVVSALAALALNVAVRRTSPYPGRFDPREEVVIPAALADQIRGFSTEEDLRRAFGLLRSELGLGYPDAFIALSLIANSEPG